MKKFVWVFVLVLGFILCFAANTQADVCYDVSDKVAQNAVNIIKKQKEIYDYCSICRNEVKPKTILVDKIKNGNPVYVNGIALDLAHTYYKQNNKFINLGIASGCIKVGDYNIPAELKSLDTHIYENNKINELKQKFDVCSSTFKQEESKCNKIESLECYDYLVSANKNVQLCYKQIAIDLFKHYYNISAPDAEKKFDTLLKNVYKQYSFIYSENSYCKNNNCGISTDLYSEYATTQELHHYLHKMITFNRNQ